jgi:hypothetical protein
MAKLLENVPGVDVETFCTRKLGAFSLEDAVVVLTFVLIAYALAEVYTSFFWQNLGRRVHSLDPEQDVEPGWWPPARWRIKSLPLVSSIFVWVPTMVAPALFSTLYLAPIWYAFVGLSIGLAVLEVWWFERCLNGIAHLGEFDNTGCRLGRATFGSFGL